MSYCAREFIERTFLIEPSTQVIKQVTRLQNLTEEQLASKAENKSVGEIYNFLARGLVHLFDQKGTTRSSLAFIGRQDGKMNTIFSLIPEGSDAEMGLKFQVYLKRFSKYFGISENDAMKILPENKKEWHYTPEPEYSGFEGFFKNLNQTQDFLKKIPKK